MDAEPLDMSQPVGFSAPSSQPETPYEPPNIDEIPPLEPLPHIQAQQLQAQQLQAQQLQSLAMAMVKPADHSNSMGDGGRMGHGQSMAVRDLNKLAMGLIQPSILQEVAAMDPVAAAMGVDTGGDTQDDDDDDDEDDDELDDEDEDGKSSEGGAKSRQALTGRGVTLSMLMAEGMIQPGPSTMSIDYLGQKFTADLLEDGSIRWQEANKLFSSPSAWAINCKKIVNPLKKSGCGWASVRYKGKKLDAYKSQWISKNRPSSLANIGGTEGEEDGEDSDVKPLTETKRIKLERDSVEGDSVSTSESFQMPSPMVHIKTEGKKRICVKHATLGRKTHSHDPNTLVECTPFAALGKIQPFSLTLSTNCLLLMDFHSHLSANEVIGYLGGKWDPGTQHMSVEQAFPCRCALNDSDNAPAVELEIRERMEKQGLTLAGWYHSHPTFSPNPSLRDLESQIEYQLQMKGPGDSIQPCIGIILSSYNQDSSHYREESEMKAIWCMAPPEHRSLDYGMPMRMCYDITEDHGLTQAMFSEMKKLVGFYQRSKSFVNFHESYSPKSTYLDKLKASLSRKLPKNQQADRQLLDFLNTTLV